MDHDELEVRRLAAFTEDPAGGNPAGVVFTPELPDLSTAGNSFRTTGGGSRAGHPMSGRADRPVGGGQVHVGGRPR